MAQMIRTEADRLFVNGNVYTVDAVKPKAECIAVKDGKIVYVGGSVQAAFFAGEKTQIVDLGGKAVYPGFIDSHMHLLDMAKEVMDIDIYCKPKQTILANVAARAAQTPQDEWIYSMGWMEQYWEDTTYPTRWELDAVAPNHPVCLDRFGGHMCWVNSKALEMAGLDERVEDPQGGEYLRDERGRLTGCMTDTAANRISAVIPQRGGERLKNALQTVQTNMFALGLTGICDLMTEEYVLDFVEGMYAAGEMSIRGYYALIGPSLTPSNPQLDKWYRQGPTVGAYGHKYTVRSVKLFADGSLGARSAALLEPYEDRAGWCGKLLSTDEQLDAIVDLAAKNGFQVITHSIGDAATAQTISAYTRAIRNHRLVDPRYRIEHFQVVSQEQIRQTKAADILPSMQATNATFNYPMPDQRLGERAKRAYDWRSVLDSGMIIAGGTDAPITTISPISEFHSAVTRRNDDLIPQGGWFPQNAATREEALRSQTIWAAYATFEEDVKGSLEVGKLADFVVLDRDIMTCEADELLSTKVLMTVLEGETVYQA